MKLSAPAQGNSGGGSGGSVTSDLISLTERASDPSITPDTGKIYVKDVSGISHLFYETDDHTVFQITSAEVGINAGDAAGGDLGGTLPSPKVVAITETSGPTSLVVGDVDDGQFLARVGSTIVGVDSIEGAGTISPSLSGPAHNGLELLLINGQTDGEGYATSLRLQSGASFFGILNIADSASGTAYYTKAGFVTLSTSAGMGLRFIVDADVAKEITIDASGHIGYKGGALYVHGPIDGSAALQLTCTGTSADNVSEIVLENLHRTAFLTNADSGGGTLWYTHPDTLTLAIGAGGGVTCNVNGTDNSGWAIDSNGYMTINAIRQSFYGGTPVAQGAAVSDVSGGAIQDAEARAAINALLARIRNTNLIAT